MDADGSNQTNLTNESSGDDIFPSWSPDGAHIAFTRGVTADADIFVMNADGSGQTDVTNSPAAYDYTPAWSPDSAHIVFSRYENGNPGDMYVMNADGSNQTNITNDNTTDDYAPAWSPDGNQIAYSRFDISGSSSTEIYVMSPDGSGKHRPDERSRRRFVADVVPRRHAHRLREWT